MEDDAPFEKIAISGPTLASLIQRSISSPCDIDGLLFGHVTRVTHSSLSDDSPSPSSSELLIPTITSLISSSHTLSFYDPLGRLHLPSLRRLLPPTTAPCTKLLGFFIARRNTPLRPSMREFALSRSLLSQTLTLDPKDPLFSLLSPSSPPSVFLLLSSSPSSLSFHTHEYRAFQLRRISGDPALEPRSLDVINIGPAFHSQYSAFSANSPFPWLPVPTEEGGEGEKGRESSNCMKRVAKEQQQRGLDACSQGFEVGRLSRLMGSDAANYTAEMEDLYGKMLGKLESLARAVEKSSAKILEQENRNIKLRWKVAGSD
ncbi:BRCA1-A complex subunit Abraxas [Cinnamomum micranthum f. kanehirae]|uniref:BRCA1-A complex subunit Abraxas n=1 Tax=Cinnamomum micranthum f. kanehirae TaxID=337451 RepID=A0A443NRX8_9MAGN|nr:BRCA1-A complex subunit Abraxas [Cinnamomum micranthum f. kanehirae]